MTSLKVDTGEFQRNQSKMCIMCKMKKNQQFFVLKIIILRIGCCSSYYEIFMKYL